MMSDIEAQALVEKVWKDSEARIRVEIERTIASDLSIRAVGGVRRALNDQLRPMIEAVLKENREKIEGSVYEQVTQTIRMGLDSLLRNEFDFVTKGAAAEILQTIVNKLRSEQYK